MTSDYLVKLREAMTKELIKKFGTDLFRKEENSIRYFLTVPAIWNDSGKAITRQAAVRAGFVNDPNDRRLSLITEPEAAAIFCSKKGIMDLKVNDAFLVVDCGGGTVDLIAYEVESADPFAVHECTPGTGDVCGSTAIDAAFMQLVLAKLARLGPAEDETATKMRNAKIRRKCKDSFDAIKSKFSERVPDYEVEIGSNYDNPALGFVDEYLIFHMDEIRTVFEPTITRIVQLVRQQIESVERLNKPLEAILLVGGFGASTYLYDQLRVQLPKHYAARLRRPIDAVAAIVRGAVYTGIYESTLTSRLSRLHYLIATMQEFDPTIHPLEYRTKALDGSYKCMNTADALVRKGDRIKVGEPIILPFFRQVPATALTRLVFNDAIYTSADDKMPLFVNSPGVERLATLEIDLTSIDPSNFESSMSNGTVFYRINFQIHLIMEGGNELRAEWVFRDRIMNIVNVRFA